MSRFSIALVALPFALAASASAEEFSVDVVRGSEVVRVTSNERGEYREQILREDPTPTRAPEPAQTARAADEPVVTIQLVVETAEVAPVADYLFVPRAFHRRHPHRGHDGQGRIRHAGLSGLAPARTVRYPGSLGWR